MFPLSKNKVQISKNKGFDELHWDRTFESVTIRVVHKIRFIRKSKTRQIMLDHKFCQNTMQPTKLDALIWKKKII